MSCLCLGKSRFAKDDAVHQAHVNEFYRLMLGNFDDAKLGNIQAQSSNGRLDEFSTINGANALTSNEITNLVLKSRNTGIIHALGPHIEDAIRRKAPLAHIAQLLSSCGQKDFLNISGRDLFIALSLACSDTVRLYNLSAAVPGMPLPLLVPGPTGSIVLWDAFADLLSLPRGPLVVSVGTSATRNAGKTTLLRQIGLCGVSPKMLANDPSLPTAAGNGQNHGGAGSRLSSPSIDVYLPVLQKAGDDSVIVDCSGIHSTDPVLGSLFAAAALVIVHVYPKDVSDKAGPSQELKELLSLRGGVIALVRDSESWKPHTRALLDATLDAFKSNIVITIDVPNYLKSNVDRTAIYKSVYNNIQSVWAKNIKGHTTPSLPILRQLVLRPGSVPSPNKPLADLVGPVSKELLSILEEGNSGGRISTKIFPFSTANTRLLQLKKDERRVREEGGVECESSLTLIAKERGSWNAFLSNSQPSRAIQWFCSQIAIAGKSGGGWKLSRLAFEINECLNIWKQPIIEPLMKSQRELMDTGDVRGATEVYAQIEELNITVDTFWTELEFLMSPESPWDQSKSLEADVDSIHQAYAFSILAGAPIQLLKGTPLRLTDTAFLKNIMMAGTASKTAGKDILVVSVIGAQSSAKSTLLNFLFGCNFVTRAGRCTRGLYASFMRLDDGRLLVVLDTEGLLSIESNPGESGDVFDGQMTLLAMACSHLVLINHKGEVSRQLQDLLEVCMFALKHLRVTNFQPNIFFVLRDQHERSPTVHEDMLRHMKRHLSGCASRLGLKLEEVLRLNASSIHLLPSAYVSAKMPVSDKEVSSVNEVFPEEVLALRSSVLRVLNESLSSATAGADSNKWSTLEQWYTHCNTVWETLTQFGHNLLHYKTIREIEVRRELAQIASEISKTVLETGFKPEGGKLLADYVDSRLKSSASEEDLDTADVELRNGLGKLKEVWIDKLKSDFDTATSGQERFTATMRADIEAKLPAVLDYVYDNLVYTWKLHLKQAKDAQQAGSMWRHFCDVLDKVLFSDPTKMAVVSESEARNLFAREWTSYETQYLSRLESVRKSKNSIAYEVSVVFNAALGKASQDRPDYQLLKDQGPQALIQAGGSSALMSEKTDDTWRIKYLNQTELGVSDDDIIRDVRQLKKMVADICTDIETEILRNGQMVNESMVVDWLRTGHEIAYRDGDRRMRCCKVRQPQMLAAIHSELRLVAYLALCREEDARHKKQVDNLLKQRKDIEEHLITVAKGNAGDVDRASSFADRYHKQIDAWLDRQVTAFSADVRATVLSEMPDPAKAHERAFQQSFGARNWMDVLEYCLDVNAYLEKMFLTLFHRRQAAVIATRLPELEQKLRDMYATLREMILLWYKEISASIASGQVRSGGPLGSGRNGGRRIAEFKEFLAKNASKKIVGIENEVGDFIAEIFPPTVNFEIRDARVFSEAFREQLLSKLGQLKEVSVSSRVLKSLQEQSVQAWSMIRGCTARCPLCGSKCDCLGEHAKHSCSHHLFPAFHGWMDRATGAPSLAFCKSEDVYAGTYQCRDGEWRPLAEYLTDSHPSWVPFPRGGSSGEFDEDVTILRAAWVNCKFALEKYFTPMKASNPQQWECYVELGRQLSANDLDAAKKTIRAIRAKTWVPTIPAMKEAIEGQVEKGQPVPTNVPQATAA
jgi:hypothetical protein